MVGSCVPAPAATVQVFTTITDRLLAQTATAQVKSAITQYLKSTFQQQNLAMKRLSYPDLEITNPDQIDRVNKFGKQITPSCISDCGSTFRVEHRMKLYEVFTSFHGDRHIFHIGNLTGY